MAQVGAVAAESLIVRFERLILEVDGAAEPRSFQFHPALTVVGDEGVAGRALLAEQMVTSLAGGGKGAHAEIRTDQGKKLAIVRSTKVDDMVVDADRTDDVTAEYTNEDGEVDVAATLGLDSSMLRIEMEAVHNGTMTHRGADDRDLDRLGRVDQTELWQLATDIARARAEASDAETRFLEMLEAQEAEAASTSDDNSAAFDAFQEVAFESENSNRRGRMAAVAVSIIAFVAAFSFMVVSPSTLSRVICGLSVLIVAWALLALLQVVRQERALRSSDDGFDLFTSQIRQVDGILSSGARRREVRESRATLEKLEADWDQITGGIDLGWAISNRNLIVEIGGLHRAGELDPAVASDAYGALVTRIAVDRHQQARLEEHAPLVFSEPFTDMGEVEIQVALHLLATTAQHRQRIVLTDSPVAIDWARRAEEHQYLRLELPSRTSV